jgi:2'-5' RNA ligase
MNRALDIYDPYIANVALRPSGVSLVNASNSARLFKKWYAPEENASCAAQSFNKHLKKGNHAVNSKRRSMALWLGGFGVFPPKSSNSGQLVSPAVVYVGLAAGSKRLITTDKNTLTKHLLEPKGLQETSDSLFRPHISLVRLWDHDEALDLLDYLNNDIAGDRKLIGRSYTLGESVVKHFNVQQPPNSLEVVE